jgi:hypothetical protein
MHKETKVGRQIEMFGQTATISPREIESSIQAPKTP